MRSVKKKLYKKIIWENTEKVLNTLPSNLQENGKFTVLRKTIAHQEKLMSGQPAPLFSQAHTSGFTAKLPHYYHPQKTFLSLSLFIALYPPLDRNTFFFLILGI